MARRNWRWMGRGMWIAWVRLCSGDGIGSALWEGYLAGMRGDVSALDEGYKGSRQKRKRGPERQGVHSARKWITSTSKFALTVQSPFSLSRPTGSIYTWFVKLLRHIHLNSGISSRQDMHEHPKYSIYNVRHARISISRPK